MILSVFLMMMIQSSETHLKNLVNTRLAENDKVRQMSEQWFGLRTIPHICHFLYTTAFVRPVKSPPKVRKFETKLPRDKTA